MKSRSLKLKPDFAPNRSSTPLTFSIASGVIGILPYMLAASAAMIRRGDVGIGLPCRTIFCGRPSRRVMRCFESLM